MKAPTWPCTILLVEDQAIVRMVIEADLADLGCSVVVASSAAEALERVGAGVEVDVLLTDLRLPDLAGDTLAARLRAQRPDLGVVLMSAAPTEKLQDRLQPLRGSVALRKPFEAAALAAALRAATGGARDRAPPAGAYELQPRATGRPQGGNGR